MNLCRGIPVIHTDIGCKWWCLRGGACAQQICCPPENEITKGCPNGWKKFHLTGKCYKLIKEGGLRTFWDAANNCKKLAQSFGSTTVSQKMKSIKLEMFYDTISF